jgi:hypothetical protein
MAINNESNRSALDRYMAECFSHNSSEEFLKTKREDPNNFRPIYLSVAYIDSPNASQTLHNTELELAKFALERRCMYVTNIDQASKGLMATGLIRIS